MSFIKTVIEGVYIIDNFYAEDERGIFVKTFHEDNFKAIGLCTDFRESYFSVSKKDTIRGMHFQLPPNDHEKLVYVTSGSIVDVFLDLRQNSRTYGTFHSVEIDAKRHLSIYIPKGIAHGFMAKEDKTTVVYNVSTVYSPESDTGIRYDSFGFDWQLASPVMSARDKNFPDFKTFEMTNPF